MRFSEGKGHKVVATATAATVGRIERFVVDPTKKSVVALECKKTSAGDNLAWSDISSFGADAVTVAGEDKLGEHSEEVAPWAEKARRIMGKRVLNAAGDELGKVRDVEFDPTSGGVRALLLEGGQLAEVPGDSLIGIGSYAVVVS